MANRYKIKEIFGPTIQGEGPLVGTVVFFVRFSGCNKWSGREKDRETSACPFCDTDFVGGGFRTKTDILSDLLALGASVGSSIVFSGGEPGLQLDQELVDYLKGFGFSLSVETNGSKALPAGMTTVVCSPKGPPDQIVVEPSAIKLLYPFLSGCTPEAFDADGRFSRCARFIQPIVPLGHQESPYVGDAIDVLYRNPRWRLSLQIHKMLGVP